MSSGPLTIPFGRAYDATCMLMVNGLSSICIGPRAACLCCLVCCKQAPELQGSQHSLNLAYFALESSHRGRSSALLWSFRKCQLAFLKQQLSHSAGWDTSDESGQHLAVYVLTVKWAGLYLGFLNGVSPHGNLHGCRRPARPCGSGRQHSSRCKRCRPILSESEVLSPCSRKEVSR